MKRNSIKVGGVRLEWVLLGAYVVMLATLLFFHEQWFDEAQAWMIAQFASLPTLFSLSAYEGSPVLWHLLLMPFAKSDLPYQAEQVVHGLLAVSSVGLFLFFAPISNRYKVLYIFGYFSLYEYGVVARSYVLIPFFLYIIASLYKKRMTSPWLVWLPIALLAQTSVFGLWMAGVLSVWLIVDRLRARKLRSLQFWLGASATALSGLVVAWLLLPPADLIVSLSEWDFTFIFWDRVRALILIAVGGFSPFPVWGEHFWNNPWWTNRVIAFIGLSAATISAVIIYQRNRLIGWLYLSLGGGLVVILLLKNIKTMRHFGLLFVAFLFCYWLTNLPEYRPKFVNRFHSIGLLSLFLLQIPMTVIAIPNEVIRPFSSAKLMADFLQNELVIDDNTVLLGNDLKLISVLPYLDKSDRQFYFLGTEEWTHYAIWNSELFYNLTMSEALTIERAQKATTLIGDKRYFMVVPTWGQDYPLMEKTFTRRAIFPDALFPGNGFIIYDASCLVDSSCYK